ncbi:MAG TPA: DUF6790 family protein [Roseiarcus sp.]|jgi:hypothetical protein
MYLAIVIALMGFLPVASSVGELVVHRGADVLFVIARWFVFWSVGVRLLMAGLRQVVNPTFTAATIFGSNDKAALPIVRELGFGNLSIGLLGALAVLVDDWVVPAAFAGGLFYGLAGLQHALKGERNAAETIAMVSDLLLFLVLAVDLGAIALRRL